MMYHAYQTHSDLMWPVRTLSRLSLPFLESQDAQKTMARMLTAPIRLHMGFASFRDVCPLYRVSLVAEDQ